MRNNNFQPYKNALRLNPIAMIAISPLKFDHKSYNVQKKIFMIFNIQLTDNKDFNHLSIKLLIKC